MEFSSEEANEAARHRVASMFSWLIRAEESRIRWSREQNSENICPDLEVLAAVTRRL